MTNSRSIDSRSRLWIVAVAVAACAVLAARGVAEAGGRKRVVVLDFEGPKGDKFHDELVKLIKKTHTVVPTDKWNGAAEQLDAGAVSDKNVKKVARKLKIDAIVEGKIEKRRDEFIIRLKLRAGRSGELIGDTIDTKSDGPRIEGRAQRDLSDELVGAIDRVESNHLSGGGDDADDPPARKTKAADDDDSDKPVAKKPAAKKADKAGDDDDDKPARRSAFSRHADDERGADKTDKPTRKGGKPGASDDADDDKPAAKKAAAAKKADADDDDKPAAKKPAAAVVAKKADADDADKLPPRKVAAKKTSSSDDDDDKLPPRKSGKQPAKKKVASRDDDGGGDGEADTVAPLDAATALSPAERAVDAVVGLSVTMRRMNFVVSPTLRATPAGYKGIPIAGGLVDATFYPLAFGHTSTEQTKNIGVEVLYDRVFKLSSQDPMTKMTYNTVESRFALSAVFRYALGSSARAPVALGSLGFERQSFNILGPVDLPDVKYSMIPLGAGIRFPITDKITLGADAKLLIVAGTGQIGDPDQYGDASVIGFEGALGGDYRITPNIFARASARIETIGFSFKGTGDQTNNRDDNPMTQDITAARDTYFGGMVTIGYIY